MCACVLVLTISLNREISMEFACSTQSRSCYVIVMEMEKPGRPIISVVAVVENWAMHYNTRNTSTSNTKMQRKIFMYDELWLPARIAGEL